MNSLGMASNVSHSPDEAIGQMIELNSDPVVTTHYGLRTFNDLPRPMSEALVRNLAPKGRVRGGHSGNEFHKEWFAAEQIDLPLITEAMLRRGNSRARIEKLLGGNLRRVFRAVTLKH